MGSGARLSTEAFGQQFERMCHMWPKMREMPSEAVNEYQLTAGGYTEQELRSAVTNMIQQETFTPKPVTLRRYCDEMKAKAGRVNTTRKQDEQILGSTLVEEGYNKGLYRIDAISAYGQKIYWFSTMPWQE